MISRQEHEEKLAALKTTYDKREMAVAAVTYERDQLRDAVEDLQRQLKAAHKQAKEAKRELKVRTETFNLQISQLNRNVEKAENDCKEWEQLCVKLREGSTADDCDSSSNDELYEAESADV